MQADGFRPGSLASASSCAWILLLYFLCDCNGVRAIVGFVIREGLSGVGTLVARRRVMMGL